MRDLTASQDAILASSLKAITWLFNVVDKNDVHYYWSTRTVSPVGLAVRWEDGVSWGERGFVARAAAKLGGVFGRAFADFGIAGLLTGNLGKQLTVTDSAAKRLVGYPHTVGAVETYSTEKITGWTNDGLYDTFLTSGKDITSAINLGGAAWATTNTYGVVIGECHKVTVDFTLTSGEAPVWHERAGPSSLSFYSFTAPAGVTTYYAGHSAAGSLACNSVNNTAAAEFAVTVTHKEVTAPGATGTVIGSTALASANHGWATLETGFNFCDASGYHYAIEDGVVWSDGGDGSGYEFRVTKFYGITLSRPRLENGTFAPNELAFSIVNPNSALDPDDFEGGSVRLILMMGDGTNEETPLASWKYKIKRVSGAYQTLDFVCEDFFQEYLAGSYPGLKVHDVFPHTSGVGNLSDWVSMPLPFGQCYVPVRPAYITDGWYYVLGPTTVNGSAVTYTIDAVRSPRDYSTKAEYTETFTQATKADADAVDYRVFTAALSGAPLDGLFTLGDHYYDLPTQFSRSDTAAVTNPADVIQWVLLDLGVDAGDINAAAFAAAEATYDAWGLAFAGAFWHQVSREQALVSLLDQCHSTLKIDEQISLAVFDSSSQKTLTAADIVKPRETAEGTFRHVRLERTLADCGNVEYSPTDDAQDVGVNALVAAKVTKTIADDRRLAMPFVADADIAKQLAKLFFQRRLLKKSEQRFTAKATCLALEPGDFITISGAHYGGDHAVLIDSMTIKRDCSIDFRCTEFSDTIDNYTP